MRITHLRLADFRNVSFAETALDAPRIFLLGANGQGKTNLLEAVGMLPALRSFRTPETALLIRHGAVAAQMACALEHEREGKVTVQVTISSKKKSATVDGENIRQMSAYLGRFPVVAFCSDDIELLRGAPGKRRRWLDLAIAAHDSAYLDALRRYHAALAGRNQLLRRTEPPAEELSAFEKVLAPCAAAVVRARGKMLEELGRELALACEGIGLPSAAVGLAYEPSAATEDAGGWEEIYLRQRKPDVLLRATQRGPHRDDFLFRFGSHPARDVASEGQQRGLVLGLALAQLVLVRRRTGLAPIVLADDILGELDPARKRGFWETLGDDSQVLATGTVPPENAKEWRTLRVEQGNYFS